MLELAKANSGTNSTEPSYSDCSECGGEGYISTVYDDGSVRTRPCKCRIERQNMARIKRSGLERAVSDCRFDNFDTSAPHAMSMCDMAQRYVKSIDAGFDEWMYIGGAVGCGKTHVCTAASAELMRRGRQIKYMEWLPVSRNIKSMVMEDGAEAEIGRYIDADILYIDDLFKAQNKDNGKPRPSEADVRLAFEILNGRYVRRAPTIITSEWYMTELLDIDEGTFSRLYQMTKNFMLTIQRGGGKNWRLRGMV
jgi:DNA replication protein DnaC